MKLRLFLNNIFSPEVDFITDIGTIKTTKLRIRKLSYFVKSDM